MSIIYDALKKIEKNNARQSPDTDAKKTSKPKINPKVYLLYVLFVAAGFAVANFIFSIFARPIQENDLSSGRPLPVKTLPAAVPVAEKQAAVPPAPAVTQTQPQADAAATQSFGLSGVFFSEEEGYALINSKVVKVGDTIDGAVVKSVDLSGVELDYNGQVIQIENR